jgi:hypothetical protein
MRIPVALLLPPLLLLACTRNVDDREVYDRCFVDTECDSGTTDGCFRILGESGALGICSVHCTDTCAGGGTCSDRYEMADGSLGVPICIQACTQDVDCPAGGFACRGGLCLPP